MINSARKCNDEFGIDGYENASVRYNANIDKPTVFTVSKDKVPRDYISIIQKAKKKIPGPQDYKTTPDFGVGGKFFIPKGKTPSYFEDLIDKSKKVPGVGKYEIVPKDVK